MIHIPLASLHVCSMNVGHRVKSVSMGKYSMDEVKALENSGGNEVRVGGAGKAGRIMPAAGHPRMVLGSSNQPITSDVPYYILKSP